MFTSSREDHLFTGHQVADYLSERLKALETEVNDFTLDRFDQTEDVLIDLLIKRHAVILPKLVEDKITVDAKESQVSLIGRDVDDDFDDGSVVVRGLAITVVIPFEGSAQLFGYRPSTYTLSGTPRAVVRDSKIVFCYKTAEKDLEKVKQLWLSDIISVKQNLGWMEHDLSQYNDSMLSRAKAALQRRKKEISDRQSLIDQLKQS